MKKSSKKGLHVVGIRQKCDFFGILLGYNQIFIFTFVVDTETSIIQV